MRGFATRLDILGLESKELGLLDSKPVSYTLDAQWNYLEAFEKHWCQSLLLKQRNESLGEGCGT